MMAEAIVHPGHVLGLHRPISRSKPIIVSLLPTMTTSFVEDWGGSPGHIVHGIHGAITWLQLQEKEHIKSLTWGD